MPGILGNVTALGGTRAVVRLEPEHGNSAGVRLGALVKIPAAASVLVGAIRALETETGAGARATIELLGTLADAGGDRRFALGISRGPPLGAPVLPADEIDRAAIYGHPSGATIRVARLYDDPGQSVHLAVDELLAGHFAVLGTSGSGKSCAVGLILRAILADYPHAHIVVVDPHDEYAAAFGDRAEVIGIDNFDLPFWLFDFEEAVEILVRGGTMREQEAQAIILKDAMLRARRYAAGRDGGAAMVTVDTPVPYRVSDLVRYIEEAMGKLDNPDSAAPYLRLKLRLDSLRGDPRFSFMFADQLLVRDTLAEVVGRLLRLPANGRPLTVLDMSGVPAEVADVVVSLACRVAFDFCRSSERGAIPPILVVCEEAHRYVPADERVGFAATTRAVTRIAKEGRKYGIGLGLVSQRPAELSPAALSQCGTILSLRLGTERDQRLVADALSQAAQALLEELPSLRTQEAIVLGRAVALPMRIRFDDLPAAHRPRGDSAGFSAAWRDDRAASADLGEGLRRWRLQTGAVAGHADLRQASPAGHPQEVGGGGRSLPPLTSAWLSAPGGSSRRER